MSTCWLENRFQADRSTTYKITALVQGSVGGGLDSGISVGGGKNLSDYLTYSEVELTGFPSRFILRHERVELRMPSSLLAQATVVSVF